MTITDKFCKECAHVEKVGGALTAIYYSCSAVPNPIDGLPRPCSDIRCGDDCGPTGKLWKLKEEETEDG